MCHHKETKTTFLCETVAQFARLPDSIISADMLQQVGSTEPSFVSWETFQQGGALV